MSFLSEILARKRVEVAERRAKVPDAVLEQRLSRTLRTGFLYDALSPRGGPVQVIAEVKRASPSLGDLNRGLDPVALADSYARAGAAAISVLTDGPGFGGSLADLEQVRANVNRPLLRKDFVVDRYQLLEANLAGADAVLLIVAALEPRELKTLLSEATALGLDALVEVHDDAELDTALSVESRIVGVNNRDLKSFHVDLATSEALIPRIPAHVRAIAESGVKGPAEVARLHKAGASNFLVGEALVKAADPAVLLRSLQEAA